MLLVTVALCLCGCRENISEIVIISTNDIHAKIDRFPQLASFVQQQKSAGREVIVVDAGDRFSGSPFVDYADEKGQPVISLMNKVGYDVVNLGNHDFDYGQHILKKRMDEAEFPFVCANIDASQSKAGNFPAYHILNRQGIKLCFLGLIETTAGGFPATCPDNIQNISFRDFRDVILEYKSLTKECDVLFALSHLGFKDDSLLALSMPELDVIIGGHSHTTLQQPKWVNGVMLTQAGSNLNYAGITTLTFKRQKLTETGYILVRLDTIASNNKEVEQMVNKFKDRPLFKEIIGKSEGIKTKEDIAILVTDAIRHTGNYDFAFYNKGGIRLHSIPEGDITLETIYRIEPFANYIMTVSYTPAEIKRFILHNYNKKRRKDDYLVSGGTYEIVCDSMGVGIDVDLLDKNRNTLRDNKKYKIAFCDYIAYTNEYILNPVNTGILVTDAIKRFLQDKKTVSYKNSHTLSVP